MSHVSWHRQTEIAQTKEKMMYRNSDVSDLIDEYIHNERDRNILKSRLIDGLKHEDLADKYDMSVRQIKRIIYKHDKAIIKMAQKRHD